MLGEIPRWRCSLREFQSCLSTLTDSFLFRERLRPAPSRFLPPRDLWGKNNGAEDSSGQWQASSRHLTTKWMTAFLWRLQMQRSYRALWLTPPSSSSRSARLRPDEEFIRVMTKAVNELGLEWSPPEEPSCSRLDEWFLPGHHQALRQSSSPFFPEVHDELTKSWRAPYSSCIRLSASAALTSVDGERIRAPAPSGWVRGHTSLPAPGYRIEGEGEPSVQAVQSHICTRWMRLLGGWTSGFGAALYGCAPGLSFFY